MTEEELAMALVEGEEVTTPPDSVKDQLPSNGLPDADAENDPQYYTMKETKYALKRPNIPCIDWKNSKCIISFMILSFIFFSKIREELGMKPLQREKFSSLSSPSPRETKPSLRKVTNHFNMAY